MSYDIPSGSVTGRDGWEWNRLQRRPPSGDERECSDPGRSRATTAGRSRRTTDERQRERERGRERSREELEAELRRTKQQLECVVEQYERLLAERNGELSRRSRRSDELFSHPFDSIPNPLQYLSSGLSSREGSSSLPRF